MKPLKSIITVLTLFFVAKSPAQLYYKDQLLTQQATQQLQHFKSAKVKSVKLISFEADGTPTDDFSGHQTFNNNYTIATIFTKSKVSDSSELTTFYNAEGRIIKTIDSTDGFKSTTEYAYDANNRLAHIINYSASAGQTIEKEQHNWFYNSDGKPEKMLKIKNNQDTTYYNFILDEKGNVAEEHARRKGLALPSVYYYYDEKNKLTDIVRYNQKAKRLLPDYIFEYDEEGRLATMVVIPEGSSDYQKWYYSYFENGLKGLEACYNKKQEFLGKIEYKYEF